MPEFLSQILNQSKEIWRHLSGAQRLVIFSILAGIMALLIGIVWYSSRPEMVPLASGLRGDELRKVQSVLQESGVRWEARGDTIFVPRSRLSSRRMELAMKGVGRAGQGWDLLDKVSITAPRFLFKQKELQARCEVIAESIRTIDGVVDARVNAVVPKKALFAEDEKASRVKASVTVRMKSGVSLAPYVNAIVNLVSGAIERLEPENVKVVDAATGKLYKGGSEGGETLASGMDQVRAYTKFLEGRAQRFLDRAYGEGNTVVMVHLDMDLKRSEVKIEEKDPDSKVILHEKSSTSSTKSGGGAFGAPGVANTSMGGTPNKVPGSTGSTKSQEEKERDYDYKKSITLTKDPGGKITRLSASVQVDESFLEDLVRKELGTKDGKEPGKAGIRKAIDDHLSKITEVVKSAVGFDPARGDVVTVEAVPFAKPEVEEVKTGGFPLDKIIGIAGKILGALVVLLFLRGLMRKHQKGMGAEKEGEREKSEELPPDPSEERKRLRKEIEKTVAADPGAVARLLSGWLQEK